MELFRNEFALPELTAGNLDGYDLPVVSDEEKNRLWENLNTTGCIEFP